MYAYTFIQWLLFFYFYCIVGWLWESAYVSITEHKWVNRGFLHGPVLPIYGFGAVIILHAALPVSANPFLVFLLGMAGATVLEYFTGFFMEKLFRVRYWDYSDKPLNLNGYVCLMSSLLWGGFSLLLVFGVHRLTEKIVLLVPATVSEILAFVTTVLIVADITESFRDAMNLKEILISLKENAMEIKRLEKRLSVVVAVLDDDIRMLKEKAEDSLEVLEAKLKETRKKYETMLLELKEGIPGKIRSRANLNSLRLLLRNPKAVSKEFADALADLKLLNKAKEILREKLGQGG